MRRVRLTQAMKMDTPFLIVGDKGDILHLPHPVAQFVTTLGNGIYVDGGEKPGPSRAELEEQEASIQAGTLTKVGEETSEAPQRPYGNAPKSAWIRYACEVDDKMTPERAEAMTKADLMSRYGERL